MKRPTTLVVPYHKGTYRGQEIYCLHTDYGTFCILYENKMVMSEKCRLPKIKIIPKSAFHE